MTTKTLRLTGQTRGMTLSGELTGMVANERTWFPQFLRKLRALGFKVDEVDGPSFLVAVDLAIATSIGDGASPDAIVAIEAARRAVRAL